MCGIVGVVARKEVYVTRTLVGILRALEYRGYDSAGLWTPTEGRVRVVGSVEQLAALMQQKELRPSDGWGIAHTRWATHGVPSIATTHPHTGCRGKVVLVHNGVVENAPLLRRQHQCHFEGETDSEVIAHLIEEAWERSNSLEDAVCQVVARMQGTYAIAVASEHVPHALVLARRGSPLVVGEASWGWIVASDAPALSPHVTRLALLPEQCVAMLTGDGVRRNGRSLSLTWRKAGQERRVVQLFSRKIEHGAPRTLHELLDAPAAARRAARSVASCLRDNERLWGLVGAKRPLMWVAAACGSARAAAMLAASMWEPPDDVWFTPTTHEVPALLARLNAPPVVVAVSQSGETADTIRAVLAAKSVSLQALMGVVNVVPSSLADLVHLLIPTDAGREEGVASTKAVVAQHLALALIARARRRAREGRKRGEVAAEIEALGDRLGQILNRWWERVEPAIARYGSQWSKAPFVLFAGVGAPGVAIASEAALKWQELTYRPALGLEAGEVKHGPLALVEEGIPFVGIALTASAVSTLLPAVAQATTRGAYSLVIAPPGIWEGEHELARIALPRQMFARGPAALMVVQRVAIEAARSLGRGVDRPRNLAKAVTVQ